MYYGLVSHLETLDQLENAGTEPYRIIWYRAGAQQRVGVILRSTPRSVPHSQSPD